MASHPSHHSSSNGQQHHSHAKVYFLVWIALLILTAVTVWVAKIDFEKEYGYHGLNIAVALAVATVKASLVAAYFMHLKEDTSLNKIVFASSLFFFFIFVALTLSDVLTRRTFSAASVVPVAGSGSDNIQKMPEYLNSTPELIARGKEVYSVQCTSCHGAEGKGDGQSGAQLNPKPRNFHLGEGWKQGRSPVDVFYTLRVGVSGSSMAGYASTLDMKDRWALAHYVLSLGPTPEKPGEAGYKRIGLNADGTVPQELANQAPQIELPIELAIDRLVEEAALKKTH